jgi:hypothetical protein
MPANYVAWTAAVLALLLTAEAEAAVIWTEAGSAGRLPATAQVTTGAGVLDEIVGELRELSEVDMYAIVISDPLAFSAATVDGPLNVLDPQLFLFDDAGVGVYMNDDGAGSQSILPAAHPFGPAAAGIYYLAIGHWDNEPFSAAGRVFADGAGTNAPDALGGALPIESWNDDVVGRVDDPGSYRIVLTGAAFAAAVVSEPGTPGLVALALAAAFLLWGIGRGQRGHSGPRDRSISASAPTSPRARPSAG